MTPEEKAKAYEEALRRAREIYQGKYKPEMAATIAETLQSVFPEIKKSEDERIKEAIIATIHLFYGEPLEDEAKEMIAWLEKQGESDETKAKRFIINKGYPIDANGTFPTFEEMYNIIREGLEMQDEQKPIASLLTLDEAIAHCKEKSCSNSACALQHQQLAQWLTELKEYKEQKSADNVKQGYNPYEATVKSIANMCGRDTYSTGSDLQDFYNNVKAKCKEAIEFDKIQKPKFKDGDL